MNLHLRLIAALALVGCDLASDGRAALRVEEKSAAPPTTIQANPNTLREIEGIQRTIGSVLDGSSFEAADDSADGAEPSGDRPRGYVAALREAARLLENTAADLEDSQAYEEADDLRRQARKLRLHARQKLGEVPSTEPNH